MLHPLVNHTLLEKMKLDILVVLCRTKECYGVQFNPFIKDSNSIGLSLFQLSHEGVLSSSKI